MSTEPIRLGTRGSILATQQAKGAAQALEAAHPDLRCEIVTISTKADAEPDAPIMSIGNKGVFTKELEEALARGEIDLAVHSVKDLPCTLDERFVLAATLQREDPRDVLLVRPGISIEAPAGLPKAPRIGTGSLRRKAQFLAIRPDAKVNDLRGNIDTRIRKMDAGEYDGIILAAAGIKRIGLELRISYFFPTTEIYPAAGQGAIGLEARADDGRMRRLAASAGHEETYQAIAAERKLMERLGGDCNACIGMIARMRHGHLVLAAAVFNGNGHRVIKSKKRADLVDEAVDAVYEELMRKGAARLLPKR